ncbi:hypothetical protein HMPREF7215_1162 [Pyramidobacter piscolens W5455]|uniref:Uncharacterized protein n=1 Tax=Pyramidobacter piscolens W5455 TaxID=352165 RepID=A0ABM9ZVA4_9BACT|nr:hypothetical protein HMPREF7215_1162 [Pyramidobacter piscolens W5455]
MIENPSASGRFSSGAVQKALFIKSPAAGRAWHGGKSSRAVRAKAGRA